ncbi:Maintenance of ploidy protein mob2 [Hanseniaspora vineae]
MGVSSTNNNNTINSSNNSTPQSSVYKQPIVPGNTIYSNSQHSSSRISLKSKASKKYQQQQQQQQQQQLQQQQQQQQQHQQQQQQMHQQQLQQQQMHQQQLKQQQLQQQQEMQQRQQTQQQIARGSAAPQSLKQPTETLQSMFLSEPFVRTALVKGSFKTIVQLPKYVDLKEWVALNVFEFYTNLNQFYGAIAEYVTTDGYPTMNAGPYTDYLWLDANNRQVSLPANQYIDLALSWISNKVSDKNLFPTQGGATFPGNFPRDVQRIMIQLFRIFAHIYHHHFDKIVHLSLEAHWNSFFAHFISFCNEYSIIDKKEMYPLLPLIESFEMQGKII